MVMELLRQMKHWRESSLHKKWRTLLLNQAEEQWVMTVSKKKTDVQNNMIQKADRQTLKGKKGKGMWNCYLWTPLLMIMTNYSN